MPLSPLSTLRDAVVAFLAEGKPRLRKELSEPALLVRARARYMRAFSGSIRHAVEHALPRGRMGDLPLAELRRTDVVHLRDALVEAGHASLAATVLCAVSVAWRFWARRVRHRGRRPTRGVRRPRSRQRLDYLPHAEIGPLLERCRLYGPPMLYPMVLTALNTGLRLGELCGLRWCNVNFEARQITVAASYDEPPKGGKTRFVPINQDLLVGLRAWLRFCPPTAAGLVFPVPAYASSRWVPHDRWTGPWKMAYGIEFGLRDLLPRKADGSRYDGVWHLLRHTFASRYVIKRGGGCIYQLQKILGHSSIETTMRYAHLAQEALAAGMEGLGLAVGAELVPAEDPGASAEVQRLRAENAVLRHQVQAAERAAERAETRRLVAEELLAGGLTTPGGWTVWDRWALDFAQALAQRTDDFAAQVLEVFARLYVETGTPPSLRAVSRVLGSNEMRVARWAQREHLATPPRGCGPRRRLSGAEAAMFVDKPS